MDGVNRAGERRARQTRQAATRMIRDADRNNSWWLVALVWIFAIVGLASSAGLIVVHSEGEPARDLRAPAPPSAVVPSSPVASRAVELCRRLVVTGDRTALPVEYDDALRSILGPDEFDRLRAGGSP